MSYIETLLEEFHEYTDKPGNEAADLFLRLSDGTQVIVHRPGLDGDQLVGRDLMFSTGFWVRKDALNASHVVWGTPIDNDAAQAMISDWKVAATIRGRERAINYLDQVGISGVLAEEVMKLLDKAHSMDELGDVVDYLREVTLNSGYKLEGDEPRQTAEGVFHRLRSRL
jgi:hypothetical protein